MAGLLGTLALGEASGDVEDWLSEAMQAMYEDGSFRHPNYNYQCGIPNEVTRASRRPRSIAA